MSVNTIRRAAAELRATVHGCNANPALVTDIDLKLATADCLDNAAQDLEMQSPGGELERNWDMRIHIAGERALAVACAVLGEPPDPGPDTPSPVPGPVAASPEVNQGGSSTSTPTENRESA